MEINGGKGGLHGALNNVERDDVYLIDVTSFYPNIMVNNPDLLPRCRYKNRYAELLKMKMDGMNEIKLLLNKCYGLNDADKRERICEYGQSIMRDLINGVGGELIQVNTDGIIVKDGNLKAVENWEKSCGMKCKITHLKKIVQKDVNNYCALLDDDKIIKKGAILNHKGIQYDSVCMRLLKGISVSEGIRQGSLLDYCLIRNNCDYYEIEGEKRRYQSGCCRYVLTKNDKGLLIDGIKVADSARVVMGELQYYEIDNIDYSAYGFMAKLVWEKWND